MIGAVFQFVNEIVEVRINGSNCLFRTLNTFGGFVPIDALNLDKKGVILEHPDLEGAENWREEAVERFKNKLKNYESETQRMNYIIEDLRKYGYQPLHMQRAGHRPQKIK